MNAAFRLTQKDLHSRARTGVLKTAHGEVQTPVFMPVGTQGTVKSCTPDELQQAGSQIILGNTYHLCLRPGADIVEKAGGLHKFMSWPKPILTDSGGFQVHSLSDLREVSAGGVVFKSHIDGSYHEFTPESTVDVQMSLGSDIMMVLDECPPYPCTAEYAAKSVGRTSDWAKRCLTKWLSAAPKLDYEQLLFAIVQGSTIPDLRKRSVSELMEMNFPGYAIGGLSIGEPKQVLFEIVGLCTSLLPQEKPRYLMGMGKPEDIVAGIALGVDMFDCVLPTRNGRKGQVFTWEGPTNLRNAKYKEDFRPIDETCGCLSCSNFTRAYLRHLFHAEELLGMRLASLHNIHFYHQLVGKCRDSINAGSFESWRKDFYNRYQIGKTLNQS